MLWRRWAGCSSRTSRCELLRDALLLAECSKRLLPIYGLTLGAGSSALSVFASCIVHAGPCRALHAVAALH